MLQRITDLWPTLLRRRNAGQSDSDEPRQDPEEGQEDGGTSVRVDEAELLADYRLTYWTGLIRVEGFVISPEFVVDDQSYRLPLGPDVI